MPVSAEFIDCLNIEDREWRKVVGQMQHEANLDRRTRNSRMLYTHVPKVPVVFSQNGCERCFLTRPYHISQYGIAILNGQYVYQGTMAAVSLQTIHAGEKNVITGKVTTCRLVRGKIHEVNIQFDFPIDVQDYVTETAEMAS